jgi:hypothetical protein
MAACITILLSEGCSADKISNAGLKKPVLMNNSLSRLYRRVKIFDEKQKAYFDLLGFFKIKNPDFTEMVQSDLLLWARRVSIVPVFFQCSRIPLKITLSGTANNYSA